MNIINALVVSFSALFIAFDVFGLGQDFVLVLKDSNLKQRKTMLLDSVYFSFLVIAAVMLLFWIASKLLGISRIDFQISGGILLLAIAYSCFRGKQIQALVSKDITKFGRPMKLLVSLSGLVMALVLMCLYGVIITVLALAVNLWLVFYFFVNFEKVQRVLQDTGLGLLSKLMNILLSAFAIMLIRQGIISMR